MANALGKWFLSKIGGIKPSVTTPVVKDEEVLSLLAKGQNKGLMSKSKRVAA